MPPSEPTTPSAPRFSLKLAFHIVLGLLFSGLFVWLAVKDVNWEQFWADAAQMKFGFVIAYAGILGTTHLMRLWRWGLTIRAMDEISWKRIWTVGAVGMAAIFLLPARLGEFVRPILITRDQKLNFGEATATVVIERLADGVAMSLVLFGTVLWLGDQEVPGEFLASGYVAAGVFGGGSLGLAVSAVLFPWIEPLLRKLLGLISESLAEKIISIIAGFFNALKLLRSWKVAVPYLLTTLVIWGLSGLGLWVLFQALPATSGLALMAAFATLSMLVVGIMVPAGPGTVGVFHWSVAFALGIFAVDGSTGLLVATLVHLVVAFVNVTAGAAGWIVGDISMPSLTRKSQDSSSS